MGRTRLQDSAAGQPLSSIPAAALRAVWREGYPKAQLRRDIGAGALVGIVALPLSMALAIAVGVPPQQGLYTAIVAGFLAAALGGSRVQVVGPTAAFIVLLAPVTARFGMGGLLMAGLLAGLILIALGLLRMGRLIEFIPFPVTTGFTAGIAVVIAVLQLKDFLGLRLAHAPDHFLERIGAMWQARGTFSIWEFGIGMLTLTVLLTAKLPKRWLARLPRWLLRIPAPMVALPLAAVAAWLLTHGFPGAHVETLGSRFQTEIGGRIVEGIPQVPPLPGWPWSAPGPGGQPFRLNLETLRLLFPSAFAIAMLGAIESLLSAVVADGMAGTRHDPDAELFGLGVANVITPFFGGIPATGAIARTAANFRYGGRTPVASMVHAVTILLAILVLAPFLKYLPMASLAALLLVVAWNISEVEHVIHTLKTAPRSDALVLLTCFGLTVVFDMVIAVSIGILLAAMLFMRRMASVAEGRIAPPDAANLPGPLPEDVVVYDLVGPLFFGGAERALSAIRQLPERVSVVLFRMDQVLTVDLTGLVALEGVLREMARHRMRAILVGLKPAVREALERAGIQPSEIEGLVVCENLDEAWRHLQAADR